MAVSKTASSTSASKAAASKQKAASSAYGAPAQRTQSSRKGKRAWRKNVDIEPVEEGLEGLRAEERVTGTFLQNKKDDELFQVDVQGDDEVRRTLPKFSERVLTSTKILSERSAVPAVFSRTASSAKVEKRKAVSHEDKSRLLRMSKRLRKGPFNAYMDPDQVGEGSALLELSEAAKKAGTYDVWSEDVPERPAVKAPQTDNPRTHIALPAVPSPHEGTSYNPPLTAHQQLLRAAHEKEEQKAKSAEEVEQLKKKLEQARATAAAEAAAAQGVAPGMKVDEPVEDETNEAESADPLPPKKMPERKTKQQRRKAERLRAEKRALAEKAARKRMLATVDSAKALRKAIARNLATRERLRAQRQAALQEKLRSGLAGQRIGKHVVPEGEIDVQLGEELSESLRGLKPEGNLFRDRFLNMQQRALIEPHAPNPAKKPRRKTKEYEKHSYKRFDRGF
ncbi:P60-like protein [Cubamyces sp. BRFM 1775]|nr:P60-like protein [Cubamyces sp. BRFM 1775]